MYLKGLELNGFKSFSSKVSIDFNKGIIGIVGPNGSGKSNILDAVLWVLGEQSYKSIRAKDSSDVIFSGGKNRKARSSASVSLIIDNADRYFDIENDEVIINRTISRSGDSSYSINNRKSRLKDITNLFMDTGIGKQAYSVIGQGKVERIISSSSLELRNIIDEAAGIKKAKSEKEISFKKLKNVEDEIEKIEFVEENLRQRVDSLEKQSKKARIYSAYTNDINTLKYMVSKYKIDNLSIANENIIKDQKIYADKLDNLKNRHEELITLISKNNNRKSEIENLLDEIFSKNKEYDEKLSELKDRQIEFISKKANFDAEVNNKEIKKEELIKDIDKLKVDLEEVKSQKDLIEKDYSDLSVHIKEIEELQNKKIDKKNKLTETLKNLDEEYKKFEVDKIKISADNEDLEKRIIKAKKRNEQTLEEKETAIKKLESINKGHDTNNNYENMLVKNTEIKDKLNKLNDIIHKDKIAYQDIKSEYISIKSSLDNLSQMNRAIQFVHNNSKNDNKVYGPLISMIDIDPKYQLAISVLASYSFNDIVVEDDKVATKYINLLKKDRVGTCSFLPINRLNSRKLINDKFGDLIYARNVVKNISNNSNINKVIEHVFANSLIVDKIENALSVSKNFRDKIVSLDGDIINSSGRITGGYINKKLDDTLFKRQRLKELEEKKNVLEEKIKSNAKTINDLTNELTESNIKISNLKEEYDDYKRKKNSLAREIDTYIFEIEENNNFVIEKSKEIEINKKALKNIDISIVKNANTKNQLKEELEELEKTESYDEDLNNFRIKKAILEEKKSNIEFKFTEKDEVYTKLSTELKSIMQFINNKDKLYNDLDKELEETKHEIENIGSKNTKSQKDIENLTRENSNLSNEHTKLLDERNEVDLKIADNNNRNDRLAENLERNNEIIEQNKEMLSELIDFETDILKNLNYKIIEDEGNLKLCEKKITLNERSRANLGEVNLASIEEYKVENSKYEKLVNDKFDLNRSRESILDLIKDIDEDIIRRFSVAIDEISNNFKYMCNELLNGAKGNIKIQDTDNPIETGIELSVKYKNKPEQSLSLLSGGEKSMLAVSFIMSIFMYKPSPFTFFDEVEAALDENNTKKLIGLLKRFDSSQFILITHNKETMKGADRLYGVTMKKDVGESIIVSVDI
ncbi:chromosome segregation protein SMC [Oceanivirga salmonicida]|uniref:chromosome segregation protein SMC n=1 Tax=Oceanivirga salmonicida TaxID=1769291 RepID=UPI0008317934|nr:chromosome segregation protein SMC [Oceanivirga salmonicida]